MKHIVVTGASRGIGFDLAQKLANEGHYVYAIARTKSKLEKLKALFPSQITIFKVDLSESGEVTSFVSQLPNKIDGVIHNAGALVNRPFAELDDADWQHMWDTNVMSGVRLTRALIKKMGKGAQLLFISSMGGFQGSTKFPGLSAYSVSKAAVSVLAECLAVELREKKVCANALCLGAVQTEMLEEAFPGFKAPVSPEQMGGFVARFFLNEAQFFNGQVIPVTLQNPD